MAETIPATADEIKSCCANLYASDWARMLLGDSLHPGGLALTERLGVLLELRPGQRVLDVAAGTGASACLLSRRFGCEVIGLDYSAETVSGANERAHREGLAERVTFQQGDAERLPFGRASFDAIICECAFCTFPDKLTAAAEFARVLRPGGRLGLADLTRDGPLPDELQTLVAWVACIGDARPMAEYRACLCAAGFEEPLVEPHAEALSEMVRTIRTRLLGAEVLARVNKLALPSGGLEQARHVARAAAEAIRGGQLGYSLLVATRA